MPATIRVTGRHVTVPKELKDYLAKKLPRLERHTGEKAIKAELTVAKDGPVFLVEIHFRSGTIDMVSKQKDGDPKRAIDVLVDKIERALAKKLMKSKDGVRKKSNPRTSVVAEEVAKPAAPSKKRGSRRSNTVGVPIVLNKLGVRVFHEAQAVELESLTVEEAAEQLFFKDENFLCFTDIDTGKLAVMFRRKDGHFGIVEPN